MDASGTTEQQRRRRKGKHRRRCHVTVQKSQPSTVKSRNRYPKAYHAGLVAPDFNTLFHAPQSAH